jgi:hypothetical protein
MTTTAPPRDRAVEVQKARERTRERYGQASLAAASPANRGAASQKPGLEAGC